MVDMALLEFTSVFMSTGWMGPEFPSEDLFFARSLGSGGR